MAAQDGAWRMRLSTAADRAFLCRLYASTRQQELQAWGWDSAAQAAFLDLQFRAQQAQQQRCWPDARDEIVLVSGEPAGRRLVHRSPAGIHLVDIALLPERRGCGLGSALVCELLDEAAQMGSALSLQVLAGSPAQGLYERLGLRATGASTAPYVGMAWRARASLHDGAAATPQQTGPG